MSNDSDILGKLKESGMYPYIAAQIHDSTLPMGQHILFDSPIGNGKDNISQRIQGCLNNNITNFQDCVHPTNEEAFSAAMGIGSILAGGLVKVEGEDILPCVNSFDPLTLVWTSLGLRRIMDIQPGDEVLSYNENLSQNGYYPVTAVHRNMDPALTYLWVKSNTTGAKEMITTTPEHPFYLAGNVDGSTRPAPIGHEDLSARWVGAGHLKDGDRLRMADGTQGTVVNVRTEQETREMFNLTVDTAHTFYVGANGWLVHNCPDAGDLPTSSTLQNDPWSRRELEKQSPIVKNSNPKQIKDTTNLLPADGIQLNQAIAALREGHEVHVQNAAQARQILEAMEEFSVGYKSSC